MYKKKDLELRAKKCLTIIRSALCCDYVQPTGVSAMSTVASYASDPVLASVKNAIIRTVANDKLPQLTLRQLGIMLIVYGEPEESHSVSGLAERLGLAPAAVTNCVSRLIDLGELVRRDSSRDDGRIVVIGRTGAGSNYVRSFTTSLNKAEKIAA